MNLKQKKDKLFFKVLFVETKIGNFDVDVYKIKTEKLIKFYARQVSVKTIDGSHYHIGSKYKLELSDVMFPSFYIEKTSKKELEFLVNKIEYKIQNANFAFRFNNINEIKFIIDKVRNDLENMYSGWKCTCEPNRKRCLSD